MLVAVGLLEDVSYRGTETERENNGANSMLRGFISLLLLFLSAEPFVPFFFFLFPLF